MSIEDKVKKAVKFIENGDPWSDVMDDYDVAKALELLASFLKEKV